MLHPLVLARLHDDPAELAEWAEVRNLIDRAATGLDEKSRRVFVLRDVEGWSVEETARQLRLSESAVARRLRHARGVLRIRLAPVLGQQVGG